MGPVRLNKYLAHTFGISRREADTRINQGEVLINGRVANLGNIIQPGRDTITLDGNTTVSAAKRYTYLLLDKPVGYVCSRKKQGDSPTIYELLPRQYQHLKVAGRLDKDSCGLLLLTDDGDTIFQLTHPKFGKQKIYYAGLNKPLDPADKKRIEEGVKLEDGISRLQIAANSKQKKPNPQLAAPSIRPRIPNLYKITMFEGRNRQIRRTFKALGYTVAYLERVQMGPHRLQELGDKRYLHVS